MLFDSLYAIYAVPLVLFVGVYQFYRRRREARSLAIREEALECGLSEPATLHPVIDPTRCLGCGACVTACPEGEVLGLIAGKAELIEPAECIGHGACKAACPHDAITLVFGTEARGVDIPNIAPNFETNVPGLFIAGELGGMGLIRNAIEQGRQAMDSIVRRGRSRDPGILDVVVVGAGPAGISASLSAMENGMRFRTVEQDSLGGTVAHFPRGKLIMTAPATLPLVGKVSFTEISKERLIRFWNKVTHETGLMINFQERVEAISKVGDVFFIRTTRNTFRTANVLLAIGRRGTPRKLNVPGEDHCKVVYRLIDPAQYRGKRILVVGGGDSALEAALAVAAEPHTKVTLSYRGEGFVRAKLKNRKNIAAAAQSNALQVLLSSQISTIGSDYVELTNGRDTLRLPNDAVIVCAGGILPTEFLRSIGIEIKTKYGTA